MRLAIYGAYGFSGQLIGRALIDAGFRPLLAGRDAAKLDALKNAWAQGLEIMVVDPESAKDLENFFPRIDLLVQTAGPYAALPPAFVDRWAAWDGISLDVCGEYSVVEDALRRVDLQTQAWRGLRVPACGFESVPALWLAETLLSDGWRATKINSYYSHTDSRFSPGTRASARLISGEPKKLFTEGALRIASRDEWVVNVDLPAGFPGKAALLSPLPEIVLLPRRYGLHACASYALVSEGAARFLDTGAGGDASLNAGVSRRPRTQPTAAERAKHLFTVALQAWNEEGELRVAKLHGRDPYGFSVWLVRRLIEILVKMKMVDGFDGLEKLDGSENLKTLEQFKNRPSGLLTPDQIFPAAMGLPEAKEALGFRWEVCEKTSP